MSGLDKLLGRDMPEIAYLKQTNIAQVLSKGLAETFRVKPNDPKTYFAKFLLNYAQEQKTDNLVSLESVFDLTENKAESSIHCIFCVHPLQALQHLYKNGSFPLTNFPLSLHIDLTVCNVWALRSTSVRELPCVHAKRTRKP